MNHDLSRDDSDRSYDPLERQIFQMAKQASKEADRMRNVSENSRTAREVTRRGGGGGNGTLGRNRPRSVGALRRGNVHTSGSEGTRFSSGPDGDSEYTRSDTEKMGRQRPTNPVEYVSGTGLKRFFTSGSTNRPEVTTVFDNEIDNIDSLTLNVQFKPVLNSFDILIPVQTSSI